MIGVIALAGIVVNNAIILVEYLNRFKGKGVDVKEALIESGATRMRPIVLTSLTTILGSLTIVGDPVWAGLAWSIVFGISISTVLTLVMFPLFYFMFEGDDWK
jgi:multidrug efflux pump subunit AcrB